MIPKIIWQTHESPYEDLPELYKTNSQTYKDLDGWEYRYHSNADREAFIAEHFPDYLFLYQYIRPGIYRADFWRYLVLYKYGGFYADMDSRLFYEEGNNFAKTINDPNATFNVVTAPSHEPFNNCIILCSKENPIMKDIVESMVSKCKEFHCEGWEVFPDARWIEATGPQFYSSIINKHLDNISYIYENTDEPHNLGAVHGIEYKHEMDVDHMMNPGKE